MRQPCPLKPIKDQPEMAQLRWVTGNGLTENRPTEGHAVSLLALFGLNIAFAPCGVSEENRH